MNAGHLARLAALQISAEAFREILLIAADIEAAHEATMAAAQTRRDRERAMAAVRQARKRQRDAGQPDLFKAAPEAVGVTPLVHENSNNSIYIGASHAGVTLESRDASPSPSPVPPSFPPHPHNNPLTPNPIHHATPPIAREAAKSMISEEAFAIAEAIAAEAGFPDPLAWPPGWCGAGYQVQTALNAGCSEEIIRIACTSVLRRGKVPERFAYFRKRIAETRSELETPMPQVNPGQFEVINGGKSQPGTGTRAVGRFVHGRAVARTYGSANDAIADIREQFTREAERIGAEPYIPTYLRGGADQPSHGRLQSG